MNSAEAREINLFSITKTKKSVISGVLNPASLSFNGKEIDQSQNSYQALLLNGKEVPILDVSGLKSFYLEVNDAEIELKWKKSENETIPLLNLEYPTLQSLRLLKNKIEINLDSITKEVYFDSQKLLISGATAEYQIENINQWVGLVHTIELVSTKNTSQYYNLDPKQIKNEVLTFESWEYVKGDPPFWGNLHPSSFGLGYRIQYEDQRSLEYILSFAQANYEMPFFSDGSKNAVTQEAFQSKIRYGYNPMETNLGDINYKRLTLGVQSEIINYRRRSTFSTWMDGLNSDKVDIWYLQGGFFFRWEPLQYWNCGIFFSLDIRVFRTQYNINGDNDNKTLGLTYSF